MRMKPKYKFLLFIAGLVVIIDQITKYLILQTIPLYETITVIPGFFDLTHLQNPGAAFGIFAKHHSNLRQIFLIAASLAAVVLIFYFYVNMKHQFRLIMIGFSLILGGAVGNLFDRFRMGRVVDFIDIYIGNYHWPAFNVADSAISIGVAILFYCIVFKRQEVF